MIDNYAQMEKFAKAKEPNKLIKRDKKKLIYNTKGASENSNTNKELIK